MIQQNASPYPTDQNKYPLAHAATRFSGQPTQEALPSHHWICAGCGMAHVRILPEECENCGATALEFEYSAPAARVSRL